MDKKKRNIKEKLKKIIKKKPGITFLGPRSQFLIFRFFWNTSKNQVWKGGYPILNIKLKETKM
jgi:hypothetical protein